MPVRGIVLTAVVASGVSAVVSFALGVLLTAALLQAPSAHAQGGRPAPGPAGAAGAPASGAPIAPVVRAERFELVDARGAVLARLGRQPADGAAAGGVGLAFVDAAGQTRASIGLTDQGAAGLAIADAAGVAIGLSTPTSLDGTPLGGVGLAMSTPPQEGRRVGQIRTLASLDADGQSSLLFTGPDGEARLTLAVDADGAPRLALGDYTGRPRIRAEVRDATAEVAVSSPDGALATLSGSTDGEAAGLSVFGARGRWAALAAALDGRVGLGLGTAEAYRAGLGLAADGSPFVRLFGAAGHDDGPVWEAP